MKIIDILNKKANGTLEDGFKFKYNEDTYENLYSDHTGKTLGKNYPLEFILDDEVDVIEENKEIKEAENISFNFAKTSYTGTELSKNFEIITELLNKQSDKINEIVRAVNKLIKEREENK